MSDLTFKNLSIANKRRQLDWDEQGRLTEEYFGNALAGETGEACNIVKKLARQRLGLKGSEASVDDLAEELADVVVYAELLASHFGIDLGEAIRSKFNKTSTKYGFETRL